MILACWFGFTDIIQYLYDKKADIHHVDRFKCNALHRACQCSNSKVVSFLLEKGADPNLPNKDGTPLDIAIVVGDVEILRLLLKYGANISQMFNGKGAVHVAVMNFRLDMLVILLDNKADVNQRDSQGNTMLHLAAWQSQEKIVKLLLERGAEVDAENLWKETPLQKAAEIGSVTIFELLAHAGANINHKDKIHADALIHSDQGAHYTSIQFISLLKDKEIRQSMSRRGNCWDNAPQESFFGHMKDEIGEYFKEIENFEKLEEIIYGYIDYYNNERYQYNLAKLSPNQFYEYYQTGEYPLKEYVKEPSYIKEKIRKVKDSIHKESITEDILSSNNSSSI